MKAARITVWCAALLANGATGWLAAQSWDGGGNNDRWNTANNWSPNSAPAFNSSTDLVFAGSTRTSPDMNGNRTVNTLSFAAGSAAFSLLGSNNQNNETLTFAGTGAGISQLAANGQTLLMNRLSWSVASTITTTGAGTLTIGNGTATSGQFYGSGNITKTGTGGTLVLNANNTNWTGSLQINQGIVEARYSGNALGGGAGTTTVASGAALHLGTGGLTFGETLTISGAGVGGTGALRNVASAGTNIVTGGITLGADATVAAASGGALTLSGAISGAGRTLTVDAVGTVMISGAIGTGAGGLVKTGSGELRLSSPTGNSFTGATTISAGSVVTQASNVFNNAAALSIASGASLALNNLTQTIGHLTGAGMVDFGASGAGQLILSSGAGVFSGTFLGAGEIVLRAGATLTLGADFNAPNIRITLAGGTLDLGGHAATFGNLNITGDSILDFGNSVASILTVNDIAFQSGALQLGIEGWIDLVDYFYAQNFTGVTPDARGQAPQNQIVFNGFAGNSTAWQAFDRQVTPAPEPRVTAAIMVALALGLVVWRRRGTGKAACTGRAVARTL